MKKTLSLSKIMLKNFYNAPFSNEKELSLPKKTLKILGILMISLSLMGFTFFVTRSTILSLKAKNQESLLIFTSISSLTILLFLTLITYTPTVLYFSEDLESLLPLPITARQILTAKIITIYFTGLLSITYIYIPIGLNYFFLVQPSLIFLLKFLLVGLFIPIIPTIIVSLVIVLLFSFVPKTNNKDLFTYFSSFLMIFLVFYLNFISKQDQESTWIFNLFANKDSPVINSLTSLLPTIPMFARFITENNLLLGLTAIAGTLGAACLSLVIMEHFYFKGLLSSRDERQGQIKRKENNSQKKYQQKTVLASLVLIDFRYIIRTPLLAINYLMGFIIIPLSIFFPLLMGIKEKGISEILNPIEEMQDFLLLINKNYLIAGTLAISFLISYFISSMSSIASTSFSREGDNMLNYQILPISLIDLLYAKLLLANLLAAVPALIFIFGAMIFIGLPLYLLIFALIAVFLGINLSNLVGLLIDTLYPKLVWDDITQALKQNIMTVVPVLSSFILISVLGFIFYKFPKPLTVYLLLIIITLIELFLFFYIKNKAVFELQKSIEKI